MKIRIIIRGVLGFFPFINTHKKGTGGTSSARYCYSVWLRHLSMLSQSGMHNLPKSVAEIGPGDSLGIGLNALITGASKYFAFDIIEHANPAKNLETFEELIELYRSKTPIPDDKEFPKVKPKLKNYDFPTHVLDDDYLVKVLNKKRINKIRDAIISETKNDITIRYVVPWDKLSVVSESIDLIFSQAVMEHVINVDESYKTMYNWLKHGGFLSHEIDYSAHETHKEWFGHWRYPSWLWKIIMKGRRYHINRFPNSFHINSLINNKFEIIKQKPFYNKKAGLISSSLKKVNTYTDNDLLISSNYIIAKKN